MRLPEIVALVFTFITLALLAGDLARPRLFLRVLTRPNWKSWLVKGAWILNVFVGLLVATMLLRLLGAAAAADGLRWGSAVVALGVAGYTAFLFWQCEGRDLWQSRLLLPHLIAQAFLCGAAVYLVLLPDSRPLKLIFLLASLVHLALALGEKFRRHVTDNARQAAAFLSSIKMFGWRPYREGLLLGVIGAALLIAVLPPAVVLAALSGLFLYEWAFVRAAQLPPLS